MAAGISSAHETLSLTVNKHLDLKSRLARYRATTAEDRAATTDLIIRLIAKYPRGTARPTAVISLLAEHRRLTRFTWYREDLQIH